MSDFSDSVIDAKIYEYAQKFNLNLTDALILSQIRFLNQKKKRCYGSNEYFCQKALCNPKTVQRSVHKLESIGLITIKNKQSKFRELEYIGDEYLDKLNPYSDKTSKYTRTNSLYTRTNSPSNSDKMSDKYKVNKNKEKEKVSNILVTNQSNYIAMVREKGMRYTISLLNRYDDNQLSKLTIDQLCDLENITNDQDELDAIQKLKVRYADLWCRNKINKPKPIPTQTVEECVPFFR